MFIQNSNKSKNRILLSSVLAAMLTVFLAFPAQPAEKSRSFNSSRGLRVTFIKSDHIPFIHAQLLINYNGPVTNPAVSYLTLLNIFDYHIDNPDTSVLSILRKLGNDFQVEQRPDFLLFKINFLPEKMQQFNRFLKALYNYRPFLETGPGTGNYAQRKRHINTQERFRDSTLNYWKYFFKKEEWKKEIAYQVAYKYLFPSAVFGDTLITPDMVKNAALDHVRAFYRRHYKLSNSRLILKGNFENPALTFGSIERTLSSFKKQNPRIYIGPKITVTNQRKVIIFDTDHNESPTLFRFEAVSTANNTSPVPAMVLNSVLFAYPTGRLIMNARLFNINNFRVNSEMSNHKGVSVICNTVRLRYKDIENFIYMIEKEKRKLRIKGVERKEYADNLTHIYGSMKVNTQHFENDVDIKIFDTLYQSSPPKVTLAGLNQLVGNSDKNHEVIVILGNAQRILRGLTFLKSQVQVIDFNKQ